MLARSCSFMRIIAMHTHTHPYMKAMLSTCRLVDQLITVLLAIHRTRAHVDARPPENSSCSSASSVLINKGEGTCSPAHQKKQQQPASTTTSQSTAASRPKYILCLPTPPPSWLVADAASHSFHPSLCQPTPTSSRGIDWPSCCLAGQVAVVMTDGVRSLMVPGGPCCYGVTPTPAPPHPCTRPSRQGRRTQANAVKRPGRGPRMKGGQHLLWAGCGTELGQGLGPGTPA